MTRHNKSITILVLLIVILSATAALMGIFTSDGPGTYEYESIRGETIQIYGQGIYQHMSDIFWHRYTLYFFLC